MKTEKYVVLKDRNTSLGEVETIYESLEEARSVAERGNAIVALIFDLSDTELVEEV